MSVISELKKLGQEHVVLYVEDDADARVNIVPLLKMIFKEVYIAENGQMGLELFTEYKDCISLILTDVQMPLLDGLKMSEKIKRIDPYMHILVLSAHNDIAYFSKAIEIGVDGFIIKPIESEKFINIVSKAINLINNQRIQQRYHEEIEKKLEERTKELEASLVTDDLTGLSNKTKLNMDLERCSSCSIVLVNLDNFDHINSTYGYDIGDRALNMVAAFLQQLGISEHIYRLASDETVFLFKECSLERLEKYAEKINDSLNRHRFYVDDIELHVTCTIGIAQGSGRQALVDAHIAMKEIREIGKNRYHIYNGTSALQARQKSNIEWFRKVKSALKQDMIIPYFQPIVNNKTHKIEKYECLARMLDANSIITPNFFIDPARLVGMLPNITKVMIEKCFRMFSERGEGFSLNITENDLKEGYLPLYLEEKAKKYGIEPQRVVLEILENISAQGSAEALEQLQALKKMGYKLALDDFGSERSNFHRLQELNVDFIKIDGSFIKNIASNENCYQIAKTISQMATSLGAKVIAEFVCSEDIYRIVKELDIDYSQGFYFGEPKDSLKCNLVNIETM